MNDHNRNRNDYHDVNYESETEKTSGGFLGNGQNSVGKTIPSAQDISLDAGDYRKIKLIFESSIPEMVSDKSIAQSFAYRDAEKAAMLFKGDAICLDSGQLDYFEENRNSAVAGVRNKCFIEKGIRFQSSNSNSITGFSERVVRSHLNYMYKYEPFRRGIYSNDTLYGFLFYMVVEKRLKVTYTVRVLKSILSYVRSKGDSINNNITMESKRFLDEHPKGVIVKLNRFYRTINSIGNMTENDDIKRIIVSSRSKRSLVFTDQEESELINYCIRTINDVVKKYLPGNNYYTDPCNGIACTGTSESDDGISVDKRLYAGTGSDRTIFEFSLAFLLGFLTGARVKSVILRLRVKDVQDLLRGQSIECLTKGSFSLMFLPPQLLRANEEPTPPSSSDCVSNDYKSVCNIRGDINNLRNVVQLRKLSLMYATLDDQTNSDYHTSDFVITEVVGRRGDLRIAYDENIKYFTCTPRQLELCFDRVYKKLFNKRREKGVRWHSQRRGYLGEISSKCGVLTASKSVGHADISTTMSYFNKSQHQKDTTSKAGQAITDRLKSITGMATF